MSKFINSLLFLGAILAIGLVLSGYKENFELMPSKVPSRLLLDGVYPVKPNPGLSDNGNNAQYLLDPNEFAGSYKSVTNNKKEWDTPCDGSSFPPTFVEVFMVKKTLKLQKPVNPGLIVHELDSFVQS